MKLLFDARYIRTDHHDGISRYSAELLAATARAVASDPRVRLAALISDPAQAALISEGLPTLLGPSVTSPAEVLTGEHIPMMNTAERPARPTPRDDSAA